MVGGATSQPSGGEQAAFAARAAVLPLERFARWAEIAAWLASDAGADVTGADFASDGGYTA